MYPLKFRPIFQRRLWGGTRLRALLNKPVGEEAGKGQPIGESWEMADLPPGTVKGDSTGAAADGSFSSVIANGPLAGKRLHDVLNAECGMRNAELNKGHFPLLVKFLDAQQDLSVQVHPDTAFCRDNPGAHLKSEAWYILHAQPGAKIYKGLKPGVTKEKFRAALSAGEIEPLLNVVKVRAGECHYLPSGTVHALGAGILAAEVQTPSDTTFRVFDWNRLGPNGKPRALHVEQALACIDFGDSATANEPIHQPSPTGTRVASCDYFTLDRIQLRQNGELPIAGDLAIWIILEGQAVISCEGFPPTAFVRGDTLLLPGSTRNARVKAIASAAWLEAKIPGIAATHRHLASERAS